MLSLIALVIPNKLVSVDSYIYHCYFTGTPSEGSIILHRHGTDSNTFSSGRVVLYRGTQWGNICRYSSFSNTEADVICHQLTYTGASQWSYTDIDKYVNMM